MFCSLLAKHSCFHLSGYWRMYAGVGGVGVNPAMDLQYCLPCHAKETGEKCRPDGMGLTWCKCRHDRT